MTGRNSAAAQADRRSAAMLSLWVGFGMLAGKWVAFQITGSRAILSDALESVVHVAATAFALVSIILSARPKDPKYPYGYGKIAFFSAGFEGGLIALAGLAILYEAVDGLIRRPALARLDVGLALIAVAAVVNWALGAFLIRRGKVHDSLILIADGQHVLADAYTSFGVVVGVALVLATGLTWLDGVVAILVGLNILRTGYELVHESVTGLMDRADPALLGRIVAALQAGRRPGWVDVHQLRAWQAGDRVFVDFHLVVPRDWTVELLHDANDDANDALRAALGGEPEVIIHFDPDRPDRHLDAGRPWTVETAIAIPGDEHGHGHAASAPPAEVAWANVVSEGKAIRPESAPG